MSGFESDSNRGSRGSFATRACRLPAARWPCSASAAGNTCGSHNHRRPLTRMHRFKCQKDLSGSAVSSPTSCPCRASSSGGQGGQDPSGLSYHRSLMGFEPQKRRHLSEGGHRRRCPRQHLAKVRAMHPKVSQAVQSYQRPSASESGRMRRPRGGRSWQSGRPETRKAL